MTTANDISGYFVAIRALAEQLAGNELPVEDRQVVKTIAEAALRLLEAALLDLNRSADALESLAESRATLLQLKLAR